MAMTGQDDLVPCFRTSNEVGKLAFRVRYGNMHRWLSLTLEIDVLF